MMRLFSLHLKGTVNFNSTSCLTNKKIACYLEFEDDSGVVRTADYFGTTFGYCPSFLSGKISKDVFHLKKGDKIEVYGLLIDQIPATDLTLCGSPTYFLRLLK